jgi:biofilm PGA synthesis N-glycosyltransferase PgaC
MKSPLNTALEKVTTPYVLTVDADTLLHPQAIRRLISRMETGPGPVAAVAGSVLVRNSRQNLLTQMQEWDYWIGIAAVKRMQGMYSATLVAQGAFSVYVTEKVREIGGWPDAIGEDIVVTWRLMEDGDRVLFEPTAVAFTDAPDKIKHFMRQRSRWARGMFEGLREVPPWRQSKVLAMAVAGIDLLIPLLDIGYVLLWLPGLILLLLGYPIIIGLWTIMVFPITFLMYGILRHYQSSRVFGPLGLSVRKNRIGYIAFLFTYQAFCSTASLFGYVQFFTNRARVWK